MDTGLILAFVSAGILLNLTPGADVAFAMASGMSGGPKSGIAAAFGITLGGLTHMLLAVVGLSAALKAVPHAYDVIRYLGAGYLLYLAYKSWNSDPQASATGENSLYPALKRGIITNILNPKVALFFLAFFPQFIRPEAGPAWQQMLILGLIFNINGFIITSAYGAFAGLARNTLSRFGGTLNKLTSIIFGGLAARLIWE
ncbi:LysE family translocator [Lentibacter algarum]|nr:LysE family translocator [Lentibacter algarum]